MPTIDIVIVNYRSEEEFTTLKSDLESMSALPNTIHVIDNLGNPRTLTAAWNDLAAVGKADLLAFLNPDIRLCPGWDTRLASGLSRFGAVVPKPLGSNWQGIIDASALPSQKAPTALDMEQVANVLGGEPRYYNYGVEQTGFYAVLMRRDTWVALSGFDERFRFYGQDHDFQRRLTRRLSLFTGSALHCPVWHRGRSSTERAMNERAWDMAKEVRHWGVVKDAIAGGQLLPWDLMSADDRKAIREDVHFAKLPSLERPCCGF